MNKEHNETISMQAPEYNFETGKIIEGSFGIFKFCKDCGVLLTPRTRAMSCPPWGLSENKEPKPIEIKPGMTLGHVWKRLRSISSLISDDQINDALYKIGELEKLVWDEIRPREKIEKSEFTINHEL